MSLILHRDHRKIWMRIIPIIFVLSLKAFGTLCSRTFDAHEGRRNNSIISGDTELTSYSAGHRRLSAYPAGVQYDYTPSMVEAAGCIPCFSSIQKLPFIAAHFQPCNGHYLFVSALKAGESTHRLGAFALRSDILRTTTRNSPHLANGVFWYNTPGYSFGFSGVNDIDQNLADVSDDNDVSRLSWLFENGLGGFRAGTYNNIYGGKPAGDQWSKQIYSCTDYPTPIPASQPSGQPSFQPSSQPSMQPSGQLSREPTKHPQNMPSASPSLFDATNKPFCIPSVAPTLRPTLSITPSIPKMKITVVGRSAHNVSLTIVLSANRDSIGAIFCLAMKAGTIPTSIDAVKSGGTMRHYLTSTKPITIVIPGLLALASYKAYCYVELSDGSGSAYDDVIATSQVFSTSCCHSLSFSNAPVSVYGDVSQYSSTSGNIDLSTYVFSYYLDAPPARGSVVVTPKIILVDGIATSYNVAVVPSSLEFFSSYSASRLQGNFYLNTTSAVSGNFSVSLVVTGHDRNNFTTTPTNVRILARDQPLPGPRLMTCVFHSSGGYFDVVFDRPTDQAYITMDSWYCNQLFIFVGSNATICSWTSLSTVKGTFPVVTASSLSPGDAFSIKGGYLRSACVGNKLCKSNLNSQFLPYSTVIAQRPALPIAPSVTVIVPTQIGTCNDLLIDLSASNGNGGRPWTSIAWSIKAENGNATALIVFMRNNFESSMNHIIVPRSILSQTAYSIGITLTNFLGDSASATSIVDVSGDPNLPIVSILGLMSRVIKASDILSLQGSASLSNCALSTSLNYTWTLTSSSSVVTNSKSTGTGTDPRKYIAPAYSLKAGSSYQATLTVISLNSKGQQLSSGLSVVNIYVAHGNVIAAVRGGYARESRTNKVLTLDASISSDEDTSTGSKGLLFSWSCSIISLTNFGSACNFSSMSVPLPSTSLLSLPANQMVLSTKYIFLVIVTSADGRSASQSVTVIPLPTGCPVVFCNNTRVKFNYDKVLSLPGTITGNTSTRAAWTVYYDGVPVSLDRALTKPTVDFNRKEIISAINFPLTMLPYTFVAGRTYTFRLSASPLDDSTLVGKAEIVLTVNAPPIGGKTTVTPLRGHALVTDFMMSTTGWSDDLSDYPLCYSFSYQLAVSNIIPALTLTVLSPLPYAVSLLPPGLHGGSFAYS